MTIQQIKTKVSTQLGFTLVALNMVRQFEDEAKTIPQLWLSHWEDDHRVRVVMHQEVFDVIKADPKTDVLAVKYEFLPEQEEVAVDGKVTVQYRAAYHRFVVITPKHIEACF